MQELRNDNDVLMWKDFSKEDVGEDEFIEEVKQIFKDTDEVTKLEGEQPRARVMVQIDDPDREGYNSTDIQFNLTIESWQIKKHDGRNILLINRHNLNEGTRLDLDITNAKRANITFDREDGYKCLQIDGKGIWIDLH